MPSIFPCSCSPSSPLLSLLLNEQLFRYFFQVLRALNIDHASSFARIAHQLLGSGVQHSQLGVARNGQIVQQDVGNREATGRLDKTQRNKDK